MAKESRCNQIYLFGNKKCSKSISILFGAAEERAKGLKPSLKT